MDDSPGRGRDETDPLLSSEPSRASSRQPSRITTRDYADQTGLSFTLPNQPQRRRADSLVGSQRLRHRISRNLQMAFSPSPGPTHSWRPLHDSSRRSVLIAPSVHDADAASRKFSLAGPSFQESAAANQPYVDPGYAQLNPAYDQPNNVRPVWSLAKPLPHVLRDGMVPTKDEVEDMTNNATPEQLQADADIEARRVEPTLRFDKVVPDLDAIRREREMSLVRAYHHVFGESGNVSPSGAARRSSDAATEIRYRGLPEDTIEEELSQQIDDEDAEVAHLGAAIANVKRVREEEGFQVPYQNAIPLPAYDGDDDEIHNLHTYWSVIRLRLREPMAEFLAVLTLDLFGFAANVSATVSRGASGNGADVAWAWGFAAMLAIYIAGGVSGAHLNPAMSFMLSVYRGFPIQKIPVFAVAQLLGAFCAALITYGIFRPGLMALEVELLQTQPIMLPRPPPTVFNSIVLPNFITFPRTPWVDTNTAFWTELVGTALLSVSVLALGDDTNAPPGAGMNAFIVGLLVTVLGMSFGYNTGLALNPVRDIGPRLAMVVLGYGKDYSLFANGYWFKVAWMGPITGALLGGFLYDLLIFVGGESPVNYPTRRIRRAIRKWRKRWKARITKTKKVVQDIT